MREITINIWDDYDNDNYRRKDKCQDTYIYVEDLGLPHREKEIVLQILFPVLCNHPFPGTTYLPPAWCKIGRSGHYEIKVENLTHKNREKLISLLEKETVKYGSRKLTFISES